MRKITTLIIMMFCILTSFTYASNTTVKILSKSETNTIFTKSLKADLGIRYTIFRTYNFTDKSGEYYLFLTEKEYKREKGKPLNNCVEGICIKKSDDKYNVQWKMRDATTKNDDNEESSIWFWTNYFDLKDFDGDGLIDPIMIYGTTGMNGFEDGKVKLLTYYKGKKYGVRHQNSVMDFERKTKVDADFYILPISIQEQVQKVMGKIAAKNHALFSTGYKKKMDAKKTLID